MFSGTLILCVLYGNIIFSSVEVSGNRYLSSPTDCCLTDDRGGRGWGGRWWITVVPEVWSLAIVPRCELHLLRFEVLSPLGWATVGIMANPLYWAPRGERPSGACFTSVWNVEYQGSLNSLAILVVLLGQDLKRSDVQGSKVAGLVSQNEWMVEPGFHLCGFCSQPSNSSASFW